MQVEGVIKLIDVTREYGSNGFRKRELVVTTEEQYPQPIMIEFVQDKTNLLDSYQVGQKVRVSINIRGREWVNPQGETKYFNSLQGWRIENLEQAAAPADIPVPPATNFPPAESYVDDNDLEDDLPF